MNADHRGCLRSEPRGIQLQGCRLGVLGKTEIKGGYCYQANTNHPRDNKGLKFLSTLTVWHSSSLAWLYCCRAWSRNGCCRAYSRIHPVPFWADVPCLISQGGRPPPGDGAIVLSAPISFHRCGVWWGRVSRALVRSLSARLPAGRRSCTSSKPAADPALEAGRKPCDGV